jgi:two-component system sensor histidine kinase BarA
MTDSRAQAPLDRLGILVVDDHAINREFLHNGLRRLARDVAVVGNGLDAIERCRNTHFDVIVLDLHMPRLDGLDTAMRIRELGGPSSQARLIILTADTRPEERTRLLEAGVDEYLTKPISITDLADAIDRLFKPDRDRPGARRGPSDSGVLIDRQRALAACNNDPGLADRLCGMLVAELDERLTLLDRWLAEGRFEQAAAQLHQWAGAAGYAGAIRYGQACRDLRQSLLSGSDAAPGSRYLHFLRIAHATRAALAGGEIHSKAQ